MLRLIVADALNCAMSPANLAGQDGSGKIENNRMANKDPPRIAGGISVSGIALIILAAHKCA